MDLPGTVDDVAYKYDLRGAQLEVCAGTTSTSCSSAHFKVTNTYDAAQRLTQSTAGGAGFPDRPVSYQYDAAGNRTRITHPDSGYYVVYDHDPLNRVTQIREKGNATLATYSYDDLQRRATITFGNGTTTSYAYEPDSALDSLENDLASTANDVTYSFNFNRVNQVTSRTISNNTYIWNGHYNLDRSFDVNGLNQYTQAGQRSIQHDANGNLTGDGIWSYGYDDQNRLITANGPGTSASYAYDGMGRQRAKTVNGSTLRYLYDGDALIAEFDNTSSTPLRRYVHGPGVDDPIVEYTGSGTGSKVWLYKDHQGSIIAQAGISGAATNTYAYSPWGEVDDELGTIFRYTGQRYDAETNLYYYKARYYSPTLGRFLQTDPIGYEDQQNLYAYVHNDPVNMFDPNGEFAFLAPLIPILKAAGIGFAAGATIDATVQVATTGEVDVGQTLISGGVGAVTGGVGATISRRIVTQGAKGVAKRAAANSFAGATANTAGQVAKNAKAGQPLADNLGQAAVDGAIFGGAGSVVGDGVEATTKTVSGGLLGPSGTLTPVGAAAGVVTGNVTGNLSTDTINTSVDGISDMAVGAACDALGVSDYHC